MTELLDLVKTIRLETEWGSNLNLKKSLSYLTNEIDELKKAIDTKDIKSIMEEFSDVFMVILFSRVLFEEEYSYTDDDIKNQIIKKLNNRYKDVLTNKNYLLPGFEQFFYQHNKDSEKKR